MRRSPGKGKDSAHKRMVMAATAYNLKKLLAKRWPKVVTQVLALHPGGSFLPLWDGLLQEYSHPKRVVQQSLTFS